MKQYKSVKILSNFQMVNLTVTTIWVRLT